MVIINMERFESDLIRLRRGRCRALRKSSRRDDSPIRQKRKKKKTTFKKLPYHAQWSEESIAP